jgi:uncharacterized protein
MNRRALLGALTGAAVGGCSSGGGAPLRSVVIAGGRPDGVYDQLAQAFAAEIRARWSIPAEVLGSNESIDNLRMVDQGRAHLGFATVDICDVALQGDRPFLGILRVAALAGVYEDHLQIVYSDDTPIERVSDLSQLRVSLGAKDSGTEFIAERLLHHAGADRPIPRRSYLPADNAADEMLAGNLDAFFVMGGLPTTPVARLADRMLAGGRRLRLLSIPTDAQSLWGRYKHLYVQRSIPAGTYGIEGEASTIGVGNVIVIHRDTPPEAAFRLAELLLAAQPSLARAHREARRLDQRTAVATSSIPLHPGALSYYRSVKPFAGPP